MYCNMHKHMQKHKIVVLALIGLIVTFFLFQEEKTDQHTVEVNTKDSIVVLSQEENQGHNFCEHVNSIVEETLVCDNDPNLDYEELICRNDTTNQCF